MKVRDASMTPMVMTGTRVLIANTIAEAVDDSKATVSM